MHVVVAAPPAVRVPADLGDLPRAADLVELRLDLLDLGAPGQGLATWIAAAPRPVVATLRSRAQGGAFEGTPAEAARLLEAAAQAGAAWLDVEEDVAEHLGALPSSVALLASTHVGVPWATATRFPRAKVAGPCEDQAALEALGGRTGGDRGFAVPFGALGPLRATLVGPDREPAWVYGSAPGAAVVVGQPSLPELLDELRAGEVTAAAARHALLGTPPAPSPSPAMHNAVFRAGGRDALHVALPGVDVPRALELGFQGFSVTSPYKVDAARRAASRTPAVEATGAANTLVRRPGGWHAANTDVDALVAALPAPAADRRGALVHGAGGYARAALVALGQRGYTPRLVARHGERGRALARELGVAWAGGEVRPARADGVYVHATNAGPGGDLPAGLAPPALAGLVVLDGPYAPAGRRTAVEESARQVGARAFVGGRDLLLGQAAAQARLFAAAHAVPPDADLERILRLALHPPRSLVLLGPRAAGKSTIGALVARRTGRPLIDLDGEIGRLAGRPAGEVLVSLGEVAFRNLEVALLERALARRGAVLALGGGTVEAPGALALLAACAPFVVHLQVDATERLRRLALGTAGARPPLTAAATPAEELHVLDARRAPLYAAATTVAVDARGTPEAVAEDILFAWCPAGARGGGPSLRAP